jgi:hypothetical protein
MEGESGHLIGQVAVLVVGVSLIGIFQSFVKYHLRRRAYLSSRHRAILLAYEMDDQTATRFSVLAPHFKGEDLAFSESGGTLGPLASLAQSLRGGGP